MSRKRQSSSSPGGRKLRAWQLGVLAALAGSSRLRAASMTPDYAKATVPTFSAST